MNFWHNAICDILHMPPFKVPMAEWVTVPETEDGAPIELSLEFPPSEVEVGFTVDQLRDLHMTLQKPVMGGIQVSPQIFQRISTTDRVKRTDKERT